jgi:phosphoribosylaminoimidazole (AIR) synthetase
MEQWRVPAGVVEGVEDQAGVAGADLIGGETANHFVDGVLEVRLAGGEWEVEGLATTAAPAGVWEGFAGGVIW